MKIASAYSTHPDPDNAATEAYERLLAKLASAPQMMIVHSSCGYDNHRLVKQLRTLAPGVPLQGGTSCMGVITEAGLHTNNQLGLGILGVADPEGRYGVGIAEYGNDPAGTATSALTRALEQADRPGELPGAIVMSICPGYEEAAIQAIEDYLGASVPILGGTAADNDMSGQWQQFGNGHVFEKAISIAALFPSGDVSYSFHSGYEPTAHRGRASRAKGRILHEIDGRPAAQVYNEWTDGLISAVLPVGGSMVPTTSFTPIGTPVGRVGKIPYYRLSYPVAAFADGSIQLFTDIHPDDEIVLMRGTPNSLATRAGRVAKAAIDSARFAEDESAGALIIFCAGCMLAVQDRMGETVDGLKSVFRGAPFLCVFTLGEQGCFIGGENRHGNLMIATLVFGPIKAE